jgi:hypothetical protein
MYFDEQSDLPMPCIDCGKEVGYDCECVGGCHQCGKPVAMYACGIRWCGAHRRALMKANAARRGRIVESIKRKQAA